MIKVDTLHVTGKSFFYSVFARIHTTSDRNNQAFIWMLSTRSTLGMMYGNLIHYGWGAATVEVQPQKRPKSTKSTMHAQHTKPIPPHLHLQGSLQPLVHVPWQQSCLLLHCYVHLHSHTSSKDDVSERWICLLPEIPLNTLEYPRNTVFLYRYTGIWASWKWHPYTGTFDSE